MNTKLLLVNIVARLCYVIAIPAFILWSLACLATPKFSWQGLNWILPLALSGLLLDLFADIGARVLRIEEQQELLFTTSDSTDAHNG